MDLSILRKVALFEGLTSRQLSVIMRVLRTREYAPGASVFVEGEKGDSMFIVAEGRVRLSQIISGGEEALTLIEAGEHFGEMALIDEGPRTSFAIAHSSCVLYELGSRAFNEVMFMHKHIAYTLLWTLVRTLAHRLRETDARLHSLLALASFGSHADTLSPFGQADPLASLKKPTPSGG